MLIFFFNLKIVKNYVFVGKIKYVFPTKIELTLIEENLTLNKQKTLIEIKGLIQNLSPKNEKELEIWIKLISLYSKNK